MVRRAERLRMELDVKLNKDLSDKDKDLINKNRIKEFGNNERKDFDIDYEPETKWFFLKDKGKVVAFTGLRPIVITYLGNRYEICGICSFISMIKGKGYGRELVSRIIEYSKRTEKTLLGFTGKTEFFGKAGLETKKEFIKRFVYVSPKTKEANLLHQEILLGITEKQSDAILNKLYKDKKAQRPN